MSVLLSAAVNLFVRAVPAHLMAYYPFQKRLRFPLHAVLLPVLLLQAFQSLLYGQAVAAGGSGRGIEYGFSFIYFAVYFFSVQDDRSKVLFLYIFVTDYVMILRGAAAFLEARFFYAAGMDFASNRSTLFHLAVFAASAPFAVRFFTRVRDQVLSVDAPLFWRTAWLTPAFTTAIVMIFTNRFTPEEVYSLRFLFARGALLLCSFVIYATLVQSLDGIRQQAALVERAAVQERLLELEQKQQEHLLKHMNETRAARHDLRQHLGVIRAYLEQEDLQGLKAYLEIYQGELPADTCVTFCENFALNAVCACYAEEARKHGIQYHVSLNLPRRLPVSEPEACAVLGNLLENAVEACQSVQGRVPFIRLGGVCKEEYLVFTVDNSCDRPPVREHGRFLSARHKGYGTGTWSVQAAAMRNGGRAQFSCENGVFLASVLLYGDRTEKDVTVQPSC